MGDPVKRTYQILSVFLVPVIIICGLPIITAIHDLLLQVLGGSGNSAFATVFAWIVAVVSLGLFVLLAWFCYKFVQTGGMGLFDAK